MKTKLVNSSFYDEEDRDIQFLKDIIEQNNDQSLEKYNQYTNESKEVLISIDGILIISLLFSG